MYVYMTKPGDNIHKVANLFYDHVDQEEMQRILAHNAERMALTMFGDNYHLMPYYPMHLPDFSDVLPINVERKAMRTIESWPAHVRMKFTHLLKSGMSYAAMVEMIKISELSKGHAKSTPTSGAGEASAGWGSTLTGIAKESVSRVAERLEDTTEHIMRSLSHLHKTSLHYANTYYATRDFKPRAAARAVFKEAHSNAMKTLDHRLRASMYGKSRTKMLNSAVASRNRFMHNYLKNGMVLAEHEGYKYLEHFGRACKFGGLGFLMFNIYHVGSETAETYEQHKDWLAKLSSGAVATGVCALLGMLGFIIISPVGLVAILATCLVEGPILFEAEKKIQGSLQGRFEELDKMHPSMYHKLTHYLDEIVSWYEKPPKEQLAYTSYSTYPIII